MTKYSAITTENALKIINTYSNYKINNNCLYQTTTTGGYTVEDFVIRVSDDAEQYDIKTIRPNIQKA